MVRKVLVDSNFLLSPLQRGVDGLALLKRGGWEKEGGECGPAELFALSACVGEAKAAMPRAKRFLDGYLKANCVTVLEAEGKADDLIAGLAGGFAVATLDKRLGKRLKKLGAQVISMRSNRQLEVY